MAIRKYKPTTNGRRNMSVIVYNAEITTDTPEKSLLVPLNKKAGRNAKVKSLYVTKVELKKENIV